MKRILVFLFALLASCAPIPVFAQNSGALLPNVMPVYPLANGSGPLANGFVCTTTSGTNNPLATYSNSSLTTANQNPIRLNSAGRPVNGATEISIFMASAAYRISVYAAGTGNTCNGLAVGSLIKQVDNVYDYAQFINNIGSGTADYIAKWDTTSRLTNSQTQDDGLTITTLPSDGRMDATSWSQSLWRLSRLQNSASNQFTMNIQSVASVASGASGPYEKGGLLIQTQTLDPSTTQDLDYVGIDTRCAIANGNSRGRCWGGISIATLLSSSEGFAVAHEFALDNSGSSQPSVDTVTSKYGIHIVPGQSSGYTGAMTAGVYLNKGFATMYNGIVTKADAIVDATVNSAFIRMRKASATTDLWRVKNTGQTIIGDLPNNSSLADYNSSIYGILTVREFMTVASTANTNKNVVGLFADSSNSKMRFLSGHYDTAASSWPIQIEIGGQNPAAATPLVEFALAGGMHFKYNASAASDCAVGNAVLRNNNGTLELCNNGTGFVAIAAAGTSGVTGTGTTTYIPRWNGAASLTNSGLVEYTAAGSSSLVYNVATTLDPLLTRMELYANTNGTIYSLVRNDSGNSAAGAAMTARAGTSSTTNDISIGVSGSAFTPAAPISASQGFIITGTQATAGFTLYTKAGAVNFSIAGTTIDYTMSTDGAIEFTTTSAAAVGAAGTARLRNNAGQLQVSNNGGAWANLPGAGGVGVGGSGTQNLVAKWQATGVDITNSMIFDNATQVTVGPGTTLGTPTNDRFVVEFDQNTATYSKLVNATSGTLGQAAFLAAVPSNELYMGVTSALFTTANGIVAQKGYIASQTTNGLSVRTSAGGIDFLIAGSTITSKLTSDNALELTTTSAAAVSPAGGIRLRNNGGSLEVSQNGGAYSAIGTGGGTIGGSGTVNLVPFFSAGTTISNSQIFDDGTSTTVGTQAASDNTTTIRFQVRKDQNNTSAILMRNNTSGTVATSTIAARSGSASLDIAMSVTSAGYTTASGVPASAGLLYSGTDATAGLYLKSGAGNIHFQAGGSTTDNCSLTSAGALTCSSFVGIGAGLTSLNAASIVGAVPIANGGTASTSQTSNGIAYYNGSAITTSSNFTYNGSTQVKLAGGSFYTTTSGQGFGSNGFGTDVAFVFVSAGIEGYIGATKRFQLDSGATNGACIYIGGSLQRLGLSGSNVVVTGAC